MRRLLTALIHPRDNPWWKLRPWRRHSLVLTVAGAAYMAVGVLYLTTQPNDSRVVSLAVAINLMPLTWWGVVWIGFGLLAVLSGRWPPASEKWGYTAMSALAALWGGFYLGGVALGGPAQSLSGSIVWFLMAFLWWAISGLVNPALLLLREDEGL